MEYYLIWFFTSNKWKILLKNTRNNGSKLDMLHNPKPTVFLVYSTSHPQTLSAVCTICFINNIHILAPRQRIYTLQFVYSYTKIQQWGGKWVERGWKTTHEHISLMRSAIMRLDQWIMWHLQCALHIICGFVRSVWSFGGDNLKR